MADSIPSLRRKLAEANAEIARLKSVADIGERIVYIDRPSVVEVEVVKYVDKPYPVEIEKAVEVKVYEKLPAEIVYVYQDNPAHLETIRALQEKLCLITSQ